MGIGFCGVEVGGVYLPKVASVQLTDVGFEWDSVMLLQNVPELGGSTREPPGKLFSQAGAVVR